ncbi:MAPEG family protein [Phenylobacterium sp.]|uniref:MAPEG family protein n=1 Tax=Phenylobacterium sp. TaxID=1871053 RepID=UPI0030F48EEB
MMAAAHELQLLAAAVVVGLVQFLWATLAARGQQGLAYGRGARDEPLKLTGAAGRLERSYANFLETFPLHAAAVIIAYLAAKLGDLTLWGSVLYVAARALHPILYVIAIPFLRSLVWFIGFCGTLAVVAAIFL